MDYRIYPPDEILETAVALPLSKSISARALIMAYLTPGALALPAAEETADCAIYSKTTATATPTT